MDLKQILTALPDKEVMVDHLALDQVITGLTQDSRKIEPGFIFVCISGYKADGHDYIEEAIAKGAKAIVIERDLSGNPSSLPSEVALIRVSDSREALALLSSAFYQHPSQKMRVIGITGTNGKTTTTYLTASILESAGFTVGLSNTLVCRIADEEVSSDRTTPESIDLQRMLARMQACGCRYAVLEVSSHSLVLKRVLGCEFDVGVLTNITSDHLDFHKTIPEYKQAKQLLFASLNNGAKRPKAAVLNLDDPSFSSIRESTPVPSISYSLKSYTLNKDAQPATEAAISTSQITHTKEGMILEINTPAGRVSITTSLKGLHNVSNIMAAIGAALAEGIALSDIKAGIEKISSVPGRFENIACGQDFGVIVDFAHTPDALRNLLESARRLSPKRMITVFGCGGDRDKTKRFPMGQVAAKLSNLVIITNDNARSEEPITIARQIEEGVLSVISVINEVKKYELILDRREAIERALSLAAPGDLVIIAGKGHEQYQIIGNNSFPFDDRKVVREIISWKKP